MSSLSPPNADDFPHARPGAIVDGKYRVEQALGSGGMGTVVRATHLGLREPVAVKFLHSGLARNPTHVQRFMREAKAVVRIKSEHVAGVLDVGILPTGEPFIVMDLLRGQDLSRILRARGRLPITEAVEYVVQACRAIAEAHRNGIVHRDLKPANLFLTQRADGTPLLKVLDFGISKMTTATDEVLTATSDVLGSPVYMSPEQIRDVRRVDGRCDIWALGCILYKLLAGDAPFAADTPAATLARIIADPVPPLRARRPDVPPELEQIIVRCLEKPPEARFQRVEDLSYALEGARTNLVFRSNVTGESAIVDPSTARSSVSAVSAPSSSVPASPGMMPSWSPGVSLGAPEDASPTRLHSWGSSGNTVVDAFKGGHAHPASLTPAPLAGTHATAASSTPVSRRAVALALAGVACLGVAVTFGVRRASLAPSDAPAAAPPREQSPVLSPSPSAASRSAPSSSDPSSSSGAVAREAPASPEPAGAPAATTSSHVIASATASMPAPAANPRHGEARRAGQPPAIGGLANRPAPGSGAAPPLPKYGQD